MCNIISTSISYTIVKKHEFLDTQNIMCLQTTLQILSLEFPHPSYLFFCCVFGRASLVTLRSQI